MSNADRPAPHAATYMVHWPGQDTPACERHLRQLVHIGAVLGVMITSTPCDKTDCPNCLNEAKLEIVNG